MAKMKSCTTVGSEIEFYTDSHHSSFPNSVMDYFSWDTDGSLDARSAGTAFAYELKNKGAQRLNTLDTVLDNLNKLAKHRTIKPSFIEGTNRSGQTGLHFHFGIKKKILNNKRARFMSCLRLMVNSAESEATLKELAGRDSHWAMSTKKAVDELKKLVAQAVEHNTTTGCDNGEICDTFEDRFGTNYSNLYFDNSSKPTVEMRWATASLAKKKKAMRKYVKYCMELIDSSVSMDTTMKLGEYTLDCISSARTRTLDNWDDYEIRVVSLLSVKDASGTELGKVRIEFDPDCG